MADRLEKKFGKSGWAIRSLTVSRNHEYYDRPNTAVNISAWKDGIGGLVGNVQLSRDEALELAKHLKTIVDSFDALKPKEKTVPEKIEELPIGTIFAIDKVSAILFVRTVGGTRQVSGIGSWANDQGYPFSDFRGWGTLDIRLDPTK